MRNPNYQYDLDVETGNALMIMRRHGRPANGSMVISQNNVYILSGNTLMKYNFNEDDFDTISNFDCLSFAVGTDSYYIYDDNKFSEINLNTGKYRDLDINTMAENVEICDMSSIGQSIDERFFVIDDDTMIFYDKSMKAFRKLEKND